MPASGWTPWIMVASTVEFESRAPATLHFDLKHPEYDRVHPQAVWRGRSIQRTPYRHDDDPPPETARAAKTAFPPWLEQFRASLQHGLCSTFPCCIACVIVIVLFLRMEFRALQYIAITPSLPGGGINHHHHQTKDVHVDHEFSSAP